MTSNSESSPNDRKNTIPVPFAAASSFLESTPAAVDIKDLNGRYIWVNQAWSDLTGIACEDALGIQGGSFLNVEMMRELEQQNRQVIESGETREFDWDIIFPNGCRYARTVTKFPIRDDSGNITGIGSIANIDPGNRNAEIQKHDNEQRLQSAAAGVAQPVGVLQDENWSG